MMVAWLKSNFEYEFKKITVNKNRKRKSYQSSNEIMMKPNFGKD
jgi:hypothetical protein